jgi:2-polyprenyl-3-methyl-5-hydroxy-6-metoxy-1,4-benzoquinol methylase
MPKPCPQCGAEARHALKVADINRGIGTAEFDYLRCSACGTLFLDNVPADLSRYYPSEYYIVAQSENELASWSTPELYKIELVKKFKDDGRLIEIGPASGSFCYLAKQAGFEVMAIEMDRRCSEFLSEKLKIDVVNSADEAAALESAPPADVIAMWHVIEHLVDPWSMLETAARKLRSRGVLVLTAPNPYALQFRLFGKRWAHIDAPRHLWLIPPEVLASRAERLGLRVRLITALDQGSLGWNRFGWQHSLMNWFTAPIARRAASLIGRLMAILAYPFETFGKRGAAYTIILQKP